MPSGKEIPLETIATDDLLPLYIATLCRFPPGNILANLHYTQYFARTQNTTYMSDGRLQFALATFEAAVTFLQNFEVNFNILSQSDGHINNPVTSNSINGTDNTADNFYFDKSTNKNSI